MVSRILGCGTADVLGKLHSLHTERLHDWGGGKVKRLIVFPQGDRNSILFVNYKQYLAEVAAFLKRVGVARSKN